MMLVITATKEVNKGYTWWQQKQCGMTASHIERWERNYGARLSGDMKEIVRLYKQIKEEGSK
jgi:hypothetical protein